MRLVLDTNCYVSFLNRREPRQHAIVAELMESVSRTEHEIMLTGHNMTELAFVLQSVYRMDAGSIHGVLRALLDNPGVEFAAGHYPEDLLAMWPSRIKDYGDAVLASAAKHLEARVFTFDQPFARSLKRLQLLADL